MYPASDHSSSIICQSLEIEVITSSLYYHEWNEVITSSLYYHEWNEVEITTALVACHDTQISQFLPSPAELFFNSRINSHLGIMYQSLDDMQKQKLYDRRSAHL